MSTNATPLPPVDDQPSPRPKTGIPLPLIISGVVVLAIAGIAILATIAKPELRRMEKRNELAVAMYNGKNLAMAMIDFSTEYGGYPDRVTAKVVIESTGSLLNLSGDTANDNFRQLTAAGCARSEDPFWAKTPYSPEPPDNNMIGNEALKAGEVGFGYIMNCSSILGGAISGGTEPGRIIAAAPLLNATGEFDPSSMDGKAVLVGLDSSVRVVPIRPDHKVEIGNGKTLLETGAGTIWESEGFDAVKPVIKMPKKR